MLGILLIHTCSAQELFTWSEPASNMAAKSIGIRATNTLMKEKPGGNFKYHLLPEIMWGVSGKTMVHVEGFVSNETGRLKTEGGSVYFKYRFYSHDEVHSHFRMAVFGRGAINNSKVHQPALDFNGRNSGYESGLIFTNLKNKVALSAGASFMHATDNSRNNKFHYGNANRNAIGYNFSFGKLMLPKNYTDYRQTNVNLMLELLGQTNLGNGDTYFDLAPTVQFIIISQLRVDAGYRFAIKNELVRNNGDAFLLRLEYNIFNAYK